MQMGFDNAAKKYILYRASRTRVREMNTRLMKVFDELTHADATSQRHEARTTPTSTATRPWAPCCKYGTRGAKDYISTAYLLTPRAEPGSPGRAISTSMTLISTPSPPPAARSTCSSCSKAASPRATAICASPTTSHSYSALACIAIQSNQNDQHGGQSIVNFDYGLAQGVGKDLQKAVIAVNMRKSS